MRFVLRMNYGEDAIWLLQDKTVKFRFVKLIPTSIFLSFGQEASLAQRARSILICEAEHRFEHVMIEVHGRSFGFSLFCGTRGSNRDGSGEIKWKKDFI